MDRMDDLFSTARSALETAGQKTEDMVKVGKYRFRLMRLRDDVRRIYEQIGREVYEERMVDAKVCNPLFLKLDSLLLQMEELRDEIDELLSSRRCPRCDEKNRKDARYCSRCGHEFADHADVVAPAE